MRIVVVGGGFGGVATVRELERALPPRARVEITLVSRENFFVLTPLLFEASARSSAIAYISRSRPPRPVASCSPLASRRALSPAQSR